MIELIDWFNQARKDGQLHPLLLIAVFTVVFLEIHPFQDGNGRLSRVLTTLLLLQAGYAYVPYSSLDRSPATLNDRGLVALIIERLGRNKEALELAQEVADVRAVHPSFGPDHPEARIQARLEPHEAP